MTIDLRSAIDAWREAVADAQAAERLLNQTWHHYLDRRGPAATDGLVKEVAQFRDRAESRLARALALRDSTGDECPSTVVAFPHKEIAEGSADPESRSSRTLLTAKN
ncbi:hypothetical protein [Caenimonas soli]|uniref:hypothetical protein n=1 Tax=Caenimonas soli TaxID=2735555 RepID=UPI001552D128|nr:hypothetical protein [Caenimonas soli]NPC57405.1 hypothetical protein [Caenimonas soli]